MAHKHLKLIIILLLIISGIVYLRCSYFYYKEVNYILVASYPLNSSQEGPTRLIHDINDFYYFAKKIPPGQRQLDLLKVLDLSHYDYIISCGYKIIKGSVSAEFTRNDIICKQEDDRLPIEIEYSSEITDSLYVYKVISNKGVYRMPGP